MSLWERYRIYNSSRRNRRKLLDKDDYFIPNPNVVLDVSNERNTEMGKYVHDPSHLYMHYLYSAYGDKQESNEHEFKIIS